MASLLYNPPSGAIAAFLLGAILAILAAIALSRHYKATVPNGYLHNALGLFGSSALALGLAVYMALVQYAMGTYSQYSDGGSYPHAAIWASCANALLVLAAGYAVFDSGRRRKPIQVTSAVTGLFAALTMFVEMLLLQGVDELVLGESVGWILVLLSLAIVLVTAYQVHERWARADTSLNLPQITPKTSPTIFVEALRT